MKLSKAITVFSNTLVEEYRSGNIPNKEAFGKYLNNAQLLAFFAKVMEAKATGNTKIKKLEKELRDAVLWRYSESEDNVAATKNLMLFTDRSKRSTIEYALRDSGIPLSMLLCMLECVPLENLKAELSKTEYFDDETLAKLSQEDWKAANRLLLFIVMMLEG
jgi:hypothetical protein